MAEAISLWRSEAVFLTAVLASEISIVGINTLFKAATSKRLNSYVYIGYSYLLASLLVLPSLFFSYRSRSLPPLSFSIICKIGLLGLLGSTYAITGYIGLKYSNSTLASAISNITPPLTFILALIFSIFQRKEQRGQSDGDNIVISRRSGGGSLPRSTCLHRIISDSTVSKHPSAFTLVVIFKLRLAHWWSSSNY